MSSAIKKQRHQFSVNPLKLFIYLINLSLSLTI